MNVKTLISAICILLAICFAIYFWGEWEKARFDASLPTPPAAEEQPGGHWHGDEWHADDAHENDTGETELIPSVDWQPSTGRPYEAVKPEGLEELDADDPVAKAWAKLDDIADNPFAWGGNADPRTPGLIAQLTPPPVSLGDYEGAPNDNTEEIVMLMEELCPLRDPRAIEILVAYEVESPLSGNPLLDALIAMGPPSVPYLIPYLDLREGDEHYTRGVFTAAWVLGPVGERHRKDLDGIIKHIILPKLERILAADPRHPDVRQAIARLKR